MDVDVVNESKHDLFQIMEERSVCERLSVPSRFSYILRKRFLSPDTDVIFGRKSYFQLLRLLINRIASRLSHVAVPMIQACWDHSSVASKNDCQWIF